MTETQLMTIILHAVIGWELCAATLGVSRSMTSVDNAMTIHAFAAPVIFAIISLIYFLKFNFTRPLETAGIFLASIFSLDFFLVSILINHSLGNFASLLGIWIPYTLIFVSTYLTGLLVRQTIKRMKTVL